MGGAAVRQTIGNVHAGIVRAARVIGTRVVIVALGICARFAEVAARSEVRHLAVTADLVDAGIDDAYVVVVANLITGTLARDGIIGKWCNKLPRLHRLISGRFLDGLRSVVRGFRCAGPQQAHNTKQHEYCSMYHLFLLLGANFHCSSQLAQQQEKKQRAASKPGRARCAARPLHRRQRWTPPAHAHGSYHKADYTLPNDEQT